MSRRMPALVIACSFAPIFACVKPADRLEEFSERVIDATVSDNAGCLGDDVPDMTGQFYLAIEPVISRGLFLEFIVDVTEDDGAKLADFSFQPLCVREEDCGDGFLKPIGDAMVVDEVLLEANCSFTAQLSDAEVPGDANPISGSPIRGDITLLGVVRTETSFCGDVVGTLQEPIPNLSLEGSTFGAKGIDEGTLGEDLPMRSFRCPSMNPMPDAGMPDATIPDAGASDADTDAS